MYDIAFLKNDIWHMLQRVYEKEKSFRLYVRLYYLPAERVELIHQHLIESIALGKEINESLFSKKDLKMEEVR